ncbi:MAG: hypothetical protein SWE60_26540 [Thermodesulfobacteriota bacterium]|nr:hypothetical protein [Thermodesulfobacteriota bacterium]
MESDKRSRMAGAVPVATVIRRLVPAMGSGVPEGSLRNHADSTSKGSPSMGFVLTSRDSHFQN